MVFGSFLDCDNSNNLEVMGKEVEDVEEGEISDTASVEEISEEDFNKPDVVKGNNNSDKVKSGSAAAGGGGDSRVWAVQDLYSKYPTICRGYASGLYNLAWAQAVQNKPLNDIFVMELDSDSNVNANSNNSSNNDADLNRPLKEVVVVDDDDKEEGELEEGEIDGDDDTDCVMLSGDAFETISDSEVLGVKTVLEGITVANVAE
jgi:RNA polymerase II C-terminal domain phosphatase-like 3/4